MAAHISYHHTVPPHSILRVLDCLRTMSIVPLRVKEPIPACRETVMVRRVGDTPLRWSHRTIVPLESLSIRDEDATCWTPTNRFLSPFGTPWVMARRHDL